MAERDDATATGGEKSILIVDDDAGIRSFMALALRLEGFAVDTAADGAEALDKARRDRPDAIVLDLMMPTMDGHDFIRAWHAEPSDARAPVVVMSAGDGPLSADALGAQAVLAKPFDLDALLGQLAVLV
jgi:two-component system, OmpR family, response regulator